MTKRILLIATIALCWVVTMSSQDTYIVQQFGNHLSDWASKSQSFSLESIESLCSQNPVVRVGDRIMSSLATKNNYPKTDTYELATYISCLQKEIDKGVSITFSDIKKVPESMISKKYKNVQYVSCNVKIAGSSNFNETDLFVLQNGKIAKIDEYKVVTDKNGRQKIRVDLRGLDLDEDQEGYGVTYNYSKSFPLGASIFYNRWKMLIGVDFGVNFDKDLYTTQKIELTNLMNYKIERGEYHTKFYLTVTPSYYLKYFSIGYGFGILSMKGTEYAEYNSFTVTENGNSVSAVGSSSSNSLDGIDKTKFMMRPNVKGFIPCTDNFYISVSLSYNWIPTLKERCGIDFGIGLQYLLAYIIHREQYHPG